MAMTAIDCELLMRKFVPEITLKPVGTEFAAEVEGMPECRGKGWSYAAALADAERLIYLVMSAKNYEARQKNQIIEIQSAIGEGANVATDLLHRKFGKLNAEQYCALLKLNCTPPEFYAALGGMGKREHRVKIALAIDILPSAISKNRSFAIRKADDRAYLLTRRTLPAESNQ
jgi:hypothetical protein